MAPPQVNLNEKPPAEVSQDPLPEKKDTEPSADVIVTVGRSQRSCQLTLEQRRQRKRCRIACCASLSFLLVLLLALGTACLVYRMKHRKPEAFRDKVFPESDHHKKTDHKHWRAYCGTKDMKVPENVHVDHDRQLIYVRPEHHDPRAMHMLHEYNRHLIAFKNSTAKTCYLDRLDETFEDGYARWQGYEEKVHMQNHTLRVFPQKIDVAVVEHIADVHIFEHCEGKEYEYHWVMAVTEEEVRLHPAEKYIRV